MYAVVEAGGKQYRVIPGEAVKVERLSAPVGEDVVFDKVLLVGGERDAVIGRPVVEGAAVRGKVLAHGRNRKVIVFKYKAKSNYRRKTGHRQAYTVVRIESIELPEAASEKA